MAEEGEMRRPHTRSQKAALLWGRGGELATNSSCGDVKRKKRKRKVRMQKRAAGGGSLTGEGGRGGGRGANRRKEVSSLNGANEEKRGSRKTVSRKGVKSGEKLTA